MKYEKKNIIKIWNFPGGLGLWELKTIYIMYKNMYMSILSIQFYLTSCFSKNPHELFSFLFCSLQIVYIIKIDSVIRYSCRKRELKTCKRRGQASETLAETIG